MLQRAPLPGDLEGVEDRHGRTVADRMHRREQIGIAGPRQQGFQVPGADGVHPGAVGAVAARVGLVAPRRMGGHRPVDDHLERPHRHQAAGRGRPAGRKPPGHRLIETIRVDGHLDPVMAAAGGLPAKPGLDIGVELHVADAHHAAGGRLLAAGRHRQVQSLRAHPRQSGLGLEGIRLGEEPVTAESQLPGGPGAAPHRVQIGRDEGDRHLSDDPVQIRRARQPVPLRGPESEALHDEARAGGRQLGEVYRHIGQEPLDRGRLTQLEPPPGKCELADVDVLIPQAGDQRTALQIDDLGLHRGRRRRDPPALGQQVDGIMEEAGPQIQRTGAFQQHGHGVDPAIGPADRPPRPAARPAARPDRGLTMRSLELKPPRDGEAVLVCSTWRMFSCFCAAAGPVDG